MQNKICLLIKLYMNMFSKNLVPYYNNCQSNLPYFIHAIKRDFLLPVKTCPCDASKCKKKCLIPQSDMRCSSMVHLEL